MTVHVVHVLRRDGIAVLVVVASLGISIGLKGRRVLGLLLLGLLLLVFLFLSSLLLLFLLLSAGCRRGLVDLLLLEWRSHIHVLVTVGISAVHSTHGMDIVGS